MPTFTTRKQINDHLTVRMLAQGCTFYRGPAFEHFINAKKEHVSYPPGFIRGPQAHASGYTASVQGLNGWHQQTFQSIAAAEDWALKTAIEVLEQSPFWAEPVT